MADFVNWRPRSKTPKDEVVEREGVIDVSLWWLAWIVWGGMGSRMGSKMAVHPPETTHWLRLQPEVDVVMVPE